MGVITDGSKRKANMHDIELVAIEQVSAHAYQFTAHPIASNAGSDEEPFTFRPGQWAYLIDSQGFRADQRAFSFASAPSDPSIDFGIEIVPGGLFTPRIPSWRIGDRFTIRGPYGTFQLQEPVVRDLILIGFNAGIVPFRSFLRQLTRDHTPLPRPVRLISCCTDPDYTFYDSEFRALANTDANLSYTLLPTGSLDPAVLPGEALYALIEGPGAIASMIYVAGLGAFIKVVEAQLDTFPIPPSQRATERYD